MSQGAGTDFSLTSYTPGRRLDRVALPLASDPAAGYTIKQPATQEFYIKGGESKVITFENTQSCYWSHTKPRT